MGDLSNAELVTINGKVNSIRIGRWYLRLPNFSRHTKSKGFKRAAATSRNVLKIEVVQEQYDQQVGSSYITESSPASSRLVAGRPLEIYG